MGELKKGGGGCEFKNLPGSYKPRRKAQAEKRKKHGGERIAPLEGEKKKSSTLTPKSKTASRKGRQLEQNPGSKGRPLRKKRLRGKKREAKRRQMTNNLRKNPGAVINTRKKGGRSRRVKRIKLSKWEKRSRPTDKSPRGSKNGGKPH